MKGITVELAVKTQTGTDEFGAPVWTTAWTDVANVLAAPSGAEEIAETVALYGKRAAYTLYIPKGDSHVWEDREVTFFGRTFRAFGPVTEYIEHLTPTAWNRKVQVEWIG